MTSPPTGAPNRGGVGSNRAISTRGQLCGSDAVRRNFVFIRDGRRQRQGRLHGSSYHLSHFEPTRISRPNPTKLWFDPRCQCAAVNTDGWRTTTSDRCHPTATTAANAACHNDTTSTVSAYVLNTFIRKNAETENGREKDRWTDMYTALKPKSVNPAPLQQH